MTDQKAHRALLDQLSSVLSQKTQTAITNRIALRDAVCEYVASEKINGTPLARVIEAVKAILRNAEEVASTASDELAQQLVDWCVEFHRSTGLLTPVAPVIPS
jgi:hypothetical protein